MNQHPNSRKNISGVNAIKKSCVHCDREVTVPVYNRHTDACSKNPKNMRECPVCKIKHTKKGYTCSYSCSNTLFRSGANNGSHKKSPTYAAIARNYHPHKCLVCSESNMLDVHHANENHNDNRPDNLVLLCPTHHRYMHQNKFPKHKEVIKKVVERYLLEGKHGLSDEFMILLQKQYEKDISVCSSIW